jgi:hypothetical protein
VPTSCTVADSKLCSRENMDHIAREGAARVKVVVASVMLLKAGYRCS